MARPIYLATGKNCSEKHVVRGILVDPSAGSWVCVLQDSAGKTIFSARGADATTVFYPVEIDSDAFNQSTATNLTCVILYV